MSRFFKDLSADVAYEVSRLFGRRPELVPSRELIDGVGGGDFQAIGALLFKYFTETAGLKPDDRVLDVGCGCGRAAVPMIPFLQKGEYYGFDIVPAAIKWCKQRIERDYPKFHFELAQVFNEHYNPKGTIKSSEFVFPYNSGFFDFTFLTSVFTHMLAKDMEHYASEIARTLKPSGRCVISYFLLNEESKALMKEGKSKFDFSHPLENCVTAVPEHPEAAIAFEESFVRDCFARNGLSIVEPIRYGGWPGRKNVSGLQDFIVAIKK